MVAIAVGWGKREFKLGGFPALLMENLLFGNKSNQGQSVNSHCGRFLGFNLLHV